MGVAAHSAPLPYPSSADPAKKDRAAYRHRNRSRRSPTPESRTPPMTTPTPDAKLFPTATYPSDHSSSPLVAAAARTAHDVLCPTLPRRWAHTRRVATTAATLLEGLPVVATDADLAVAAAWVHDIGYAPTLAVTGFHPLDGAAWLDEHGWPPALTGLVAHHSLADLEAGYRGHATALAAYVDSPGLVRDVLWVADATSGPDGTPLTIDGRLAEVVQRYGPEHLVSRCMCDVAQAARAAASRLDDARTELVLASSLREHADHRERTDVVSAATVER